MTITLTHRRFTAEEHARIVAASILQTSDTLELRDGTIYAVRSADDGLPRPYHFTAEEYQRLGEIGVLHEDDHFELIAGEIVQMSAVGRRHNRCVDQLNRLLSAAVPHTCFVRVQGSIRLFGDSEPQPDIAVIYDRGPDSPFVTEVDIAFVMEVSDATLVSDRTITLPLYAGAVIAEAWLVDVQGKVLERHTEPRDGVYLTIATARPGETLESTVVPSVRVPVADILA